MSLLASVFPSAGGNLAIRADANISGSECRIKQPAMPVKFLTVASWSQNAAGAINLPARAGGGSFG